MNKKYKNKYYSVIIFLILFLIFNNFPVNKLTEILKFLPFGLEKAEAVQVTIDSNVTTSDAALQRAPNVVFVTTSTVGYTFGVDSDGTCAYWKTTNGGLSWGSAVQITAQTDCVGTTIWYDQWTPGDTTGGFVHIVFGDYGDDDLWYERLNTSDDSQLGEVSAVSNSSQGGMITATSSISIVKGTDGDLYLGTDSITDSYVVKCTTTCGTAANWTEAGTNPMEGDYDQLILMPLASANIMLIYWDFSTNSVDFQIYTDATNSWTGSFTNIGPATADAAYMHAFDATIDLSTNNIYLAVLNAQNSSTGDIDLYIYTSNWAAAVDPFINTRMREVAVGYNSLDGTIAVIALTGANGSFVKFKKTNDAGTTWTSETTINSDTTGAHPSISLNLNAPYLYAVWKDTGNEDIVGNSLDTGLLQLAYRWQNDNNPPDSNTNMTASASVATTTVALGQRLTIVIQVGNNGLAATTTIYKLQFTTSVPTSTTASWTDVGSQTAISYATGTAVDAGAITATLCGAPGSLVWSNGVWYESKNYTNNITLSAGTYTELAFMVHAANAAVNTKYYLRLINLTSGQTMAGYANFPTIVTVANASLRYSFGNVVPRPTDATDLNYYFDDLEYMRASSGDNLYATSSKVDYSISNFVTKNSDSTSNIAPSWEGQTDIACDADRYTVLEVFNFTVSGWQSKATSTTCSANTDFTLIASISSGVSSFYNNNWTYWRVYQNSHVNTLKTDSYSVLFSASFSLSLSAPASVTFTSYTLGGTGYSEYTFVTSTEQVIVTDSGLGSGWTLSGTCTNWTSGGNTIDKGLLHFRADGALGTEPTIVFSNDSTTGVTEGTDHQNFGGAITLVTASNGNGVGTYYVQPTFDLYINATSTYSGSYSSTLTLTLARHNKILPLA